MVNQLMIDLESLGNRSNSVIMSIGAVMFDIETGETGEQFRVDIDAESCVNVGLKMDVSTVLWWMEQSDYSRQDLLYGAEYRGDVRVSLEYALASLSSFIEKYAPDGVWGNSNRFDLGLLENAYHILGMKTPWTYWTERDVRTLVSFAPSVKKEFINDLPHNPVNDCLYQIKYCSAIWRKLNGL